MLPTVGWGRGGEKMSGIFTFHNHGRVALHNLVPFHRQRVRFQNCLPTCARGTMKIRDKNDDATSVQIRMETSSHCLYVLHRLKFCLCFSYSILIYSEHRVKFQRLLVAPGSGPLHFAPGVPDANQLGQIPSVHDLQTKKQHWKSLFVT